MLTTTTLAQNSEINDLVSAQNGYLAPSQGHLKYPGLPKLPDDEDEYGVDDEGHLPPIEHLKDYQNIGKHERT